MNKYRYAALVVGSGLAIAGSVFAGTALAGGGGGGCGGDAHGMRGPGARFAEIDADGNGKLTLTELTASREAWLTRVDTNKDGVASSEELKAGFETQRKERLEKMFAAQDQNKDGRLARAESHMPSAWFERADQNRDGALTLAELSEARKNMGPGRERKPRPEGAAGPDRPAREGKRGHARLDENGDGKVERAEVQRAAARQLARLDRDGDGSLTNDEFRAGRGHGQRHHRRGPGRDAAPKAGTPAPTAS